ncbi:MAG: nucleotide exchange factor GrpE [Candidatus Moranbacteria bacterium]|nr:nucleotide exchange factor GrpE [Candidatus Moranbacteria bacterium]
MNTDDKKDKNNIEEEADNFIDLDVVESTEDGEGLPIKDVTKKLRDDIKKLQKEKEEYLDGWQRARADYANLQKEFDNTKINVATLAKEKVIEKLIPSIDSFELAFENKASWEKVDESWRNGVISIYQQLLSGLKSAGIERIDETGVIFNPHIHESISLAKTKDKEKEHFVEKIFQAGYKIGDKTIRPAKVSIFEFED